MNLHTMQDALARNGEALKTATGDARRELLGHRGMLKLSMLGIPTGLGAENFQKLLAQGTRVRYDARMDENWADIEGLRGYEVSTQGRVRKWTTIKGKAQPKLYRGCGEGSTVVYCLQGQRFTIDELMRIGFGDEADEMEAGYDPRDHDRELTQYERNEIVQAEGWKPAYEVAEEFRIDSGRVRNIWDGTER